MSLGLRVWTSDLVMSEGSATACDSQLDSSLTQTARWLLQHHSNCGVVHPSKEGNLSHHIQLLGYILQVNLRRETS